MSGPLLLHQEIKSGNRGWKQREHRSPSRPGAPPPAAPAVAGSGAAWVLPLAREGGGRVRRVEHSRPRYSLVLQVASVSQVGSRKIKSESMDDYFHEAMSESSCLSYPRTQLHHQQPVLDLSQRDPGPKSALNLLAMLP